MAVFRRCRWCKHPLADPSDTQPVARVRIAHCPNPQCDWCEPCRTRRTHLITSGHADLLDGSDAQARHPAGKHRADDESAAEQTREFPAVRYDDGNIDPDQMT